MKTTFWIHLNRLRIHLNLTHKMNTKDTRLVIIDYLLCITDTGHLNELLIVKLNICVQNSVPG